LTCDCTTVVCRHDAARWHGAIFERNGVRELGYNAVNWVAIAKVLGWVVGFAGWIVFWIFLAEREDARKYSIGRTQAIPPADIAIVAVGAVVMSLVGMLATTKLIKGELLKALRRIKV
jgi:hypothetical protein